MHSELTFDGAHFAHIVEFEERARLRYLERRCRAAIRSNRGR